ncbi:MAG: outer membrane beta-barrel protein [Rikenellaceae bacterium]
MALAFVASVAAENNKAFIGADIAIVKYTGSETGDEYDPSLLGGFSAGYIRTFPIGKTGLGVDVGAGIQYATGTDTFTQDYSYSGGDTYETKIKKTFCNINIPAVIAYRIGSSDSFAFRPYAGVNFRLGLSTKAKFTYTETDYDTGEKEIETSNLDYYDKDEMKSYGSDNTARRFSTGVLVGGDFEFSKITVGYQWGSDFGEIVKDSKVKYSWHTLRIAYKF